MDWILDRLACGSLEDVPTLDHTITRILTLCEQRCVPPRSTVFVDHRPLPDAVWLPPDVWRARVDTLAHLLQRCQLTVLVHCRLGVSRAPALCAAYLMQCGMGPEEARAYVEARRPAAAIHPETWRGVLAWGEHVAW